MRPLSSLGRGPAASSLRSAHDAFRLFIRQVFVNTVFLGFLDYERKEIVIPLIQVCFLGSWVVGSASLFLSRFAGQQRGRPGSQALLNQSCAWRPGGAWLSRPVRAAQGGAEFCRLKGQSSRTDRCVPGRVTPC